MPSTADEEVRRAHAAPVRDRPVTVEPDQERRSPAREAVLVAATRLFGERGYAGTTVRDIARAVGILPGSLYAHIDSKEALLLEIIEGGVDRFNAAVDETEARGLPPEAALREVIRRHMGIVADDPQRTLVVFHQWRFLGDAHRPRLLAKRRHYEDFFLRTMRAGCDAGAFDPTLNAKVAVLGILGALNWTPEWFSPAGPATPDEIAAEIADGLLHGVLRSRAPTPAG